MAHPSALTNKQKKEVRRLRKANRETRNISLTE